MNEKLIISVLNLKNGVGCSALTWNIAHTLDLDIYQHEQAMHMYFMEQRMESIKNDDFPSNNISVYDINKKKFGSGIYDLGSNINYPYIRQILKKSEVIIVPIETGYEVLVKSIATIKYVQRANPKSRILIVFNKLDNSDTDREKNYSKYGEDLILKHINDYNIKFIYIRHSFAMYKRLEDGFYYLDNYIKNKSIKPIKPFHLLQNLRWYSIESMLKSKQSTKAEKERAKTKFFKEHESFYQKSTKDINISDIYDLKFNNKNRKLIKDMLILTTYIRDEYTTRWKY